MTHVLPSRRRSAFRAVLAFTFSYWRKQPWRFGGIVLAMALATLADVLLPIFSGQLVDAVSMANADRAIALTQALYALGAIIGLGAMLLVLRISAFVTIVRLTLVTMQSIAQDAFWRVQRFSTDWHANTFAGSTVRKVTRGMWAVDLLADTIMLMLVPSVMVLAGSALLVGWRWPVMGIIVAAGALIYLATTLTVIFTWTAPAARLANSWDTRLGGALADAISANAVVKGSGAEGREDARLSQLLGRWRRRTSRAWNRGTLTDSLQITLLLVLRTVVVGTALWLWWEGRATPGDVAYVLTMYVIVQGYLREMGSHIRNLQRSVNDMEELVTLHNLPLGVEDRPGARAIAITEGRVEFERIGFHYGAHAAPLYSDFSLVIQPGERVGLVGHSGSGKTTFVKLVQRLYDLNAGRILIDGQDIAAATQSSLRSQIAIVQQDPVLFHRSIAENIAYARPGATLAQVMQAAKLANAHDFIMQTQKGYATLVGERGVKLSGGERQRVALARAFLADAPILILDEATSSLDSESEALIQDAMQRLMQGRTAIVIAHRLSTVRALDRILVFDHGVVIEQGDHDSLIRRSGGVYRSLFQRQALALVDGVDAQSRWPQAKGEDERPSADVLHAQRDAEHESAKG